MLGGQHMHRAEGISPVTDECELHVRFGQHGSGDIRFIGSEMRFAAPGGACVFDKRALDALGT